MKKIAPVPFYFGLAAMLVSILLAVFLVFSYHQTPKDMPHHTLNPAAKIGGEFTLINTDGQTVRDSDFLGRFMFIYFGFSYCPDLCPTELQNMSLALDLVAESMPNDMKKFSQFLSPSTLNATALPRLNSILATFIRPWSG